MIQTKSPKSTLLANNTREKNKTLRVRDDVNGWFHFSSKKTGKISIAFDKNCLFRTKVKPIDRWVFSSLI